jgi:hypothetical protein
MHAETDLFSHYHHAYSFPGPSHYHLSSGLLQEFPNGLIASILAFSIVASLVMKNKLQSSLYGNKALHYLTSTSRCSSPPFAHLLTWLQAFWLHGALQTCCAGTFNLSLQIHCPHCSFILCTERETDYIDIDYIGKGERSENILTVSLLPYSLLIDCSHHLKDLLSHIYSLWFL